MARTVPTSRIELLWALGAAPDRLEPMHAAGQEWKKVEGPLAN